MIHTACPLISSNGCHYAFNYPPVHVYNLTYRPLTQLPGLGAIASEFGVANLFTKGLSTRIIMIGTLTGLQWWIYDSFKSAFGLGTSGGMTKK